MAFNDVPYSAGEVPNRDEVTTIVAADYRFEDWESIWVQHRWTDAFACRQLLANAAIAASRVGS